MLDSEELARFKRGRRPVRSMRTIEPKDLLRGVISVMRQERMAPTRTRLVKFLYLADLHHARHHDGATLSRWGWYVGVFGPVAKEALSLLDQGVNEGWLRLWDSDVADADEDAERRTAIVYDLLGDRPAGLPAGFGRLKEWIARYGDTTNSLLRFVYGNTEPMQDAAPGETLDFTTAMHPRSARPIPSTLSGKGRKRMKQLIERISAAMEQGPGTEAAPGGELYDEEFDSGVPKDEGLPMQGSFLLSFTTDEE